MDHDRRSVLTRRRFVAAGAAGSRLATAAERPNFLILHTDDQRFDTIQALGNRAIQTPNMDRLVRRGITFTQATTQGGLSGAICMPSRAQMLAGVNVFRAHSAIADRIANPDPAVLTFPEQLRAAGYDTFHAGKWHLGPPLHHRCFTHGGAIFFGGMTDQWKMPAFEFNAAGKYPKESARVAAGYSSEVIANETIQILRSREGGRPFLAYAAFTSPHDPRTAPERFARLYAPQRIALPPNFMPQHPFDNGELKVRDELLAGFPRSEQEVRRHIADYYAMISEVDHQIGRVLDALDASPYAQSTYIIFAGDNGLAVGQHGLMGKQNLYEHSLRAPLILAGPGVPRGRRDASLCQLLDIAPTVCALAGVAAPASSVGLDLLKGRRREETFSAYRGFQRALRTREWKLIRYRVNGAGTEQLFHLKDDPWELHNLAGDPRQKTRLEQMRARLRELLRQANDTSTWALEDQPAAGSGSRSSA